MNADLERLIALQKLDSTADAARKQLASEPEHERALEARLEAARQEVAAAKDRVAVNKSARAALEKDVAMQQGRLSKFREQGDGGQDQPGIPRDPARDRLRPDRNQEDSKTRSSSG